MGSHKTPYTITLRTISDAVILSGFTSLDEQAKALGINRATAWTIIKNKHKLGRLNRNTVRHILSNHNTPHSVRTIVEQYAAERFDSSEIMCVADRQDHQRTSDRSVS